MKKKTAFALTLALLLSFSTLSTAQPGFVLHHQKINESASGLLGGLAGGVRFGNAVAALGDLDNDGVSDLAVGAHWDDDGGIDRGAVWILFMNSNGTVKAYQKISAFHGRFRGVLDDGDAFGFSVSALGDLDGDGLSELAVGAVGDDDGGDAFGNRGAVWILFLRSDGTVKSHIKISMTEGFSGVIGNGDSFGSSVVALGDLDGNGITELAVGAIGDDQRGAVWVLFLNSDGSVKANQKKISATGGGFSGVLDFGDAFGRSVAALGDLNGDGLPDLAVGASEDDDGGDGRGAIWILFMNANGTVKSHQKISNTEGGFTGILDDGDFFGSSVAALGDLNGDGATELAVGAFWDDDGGAFQYSNLGAVWILSLNTGGTVMNYQKISATSGNFAGVLSENNGFGSSLAVLGDLNADGVIDLAVGAPDHNGVWVLFLQSDAAVKSHQRVSDGEGGLPSDFAGFGRSAAALGDLDGDGVTELAVGAAQQSGGMIWVLFLRSDGAVKAYRKISASEGGFSGQLHEGDSFGFSLAKLGDLDGDGVPELAVGAIGDSPESFTLRGAIWMLFLKADGTVKHQQKITANEGGFTGVLDNYYQFGYAVAGLGDLNADGIPDLAVGTPGDNDGGNSRGAVWILFMNNDGTVKAQQKISATAGGFGGILDDADLFGSAIANLGDLDGDGVIDLAVGATQDSDAGVARGAIWILFMNTDGTVKAQQKINDTSGGFTGVLDDYDLFGTSVSVLGDLDGDRVGDVAVGAIENNSKGSLRGALWILFLRNNGMVKAHQKIGAGEGGFSGSLDEMDVFGTTVASLGDLDGDRLPDLAAGVPGDDDSGLDKGAVWMLFLDGIPSTSVREIVGEIPASFMLEQNYPNPFNPETVIRYQLPVASEVRLTIFNALGQEIRTLVNGRQSPGLKSVVWDGKNDLGQPVNSGIYFYTLKAGERVQTKKMLLMR
jgi:hypothetical protein